jgi:hypothetical protein
MKRICQLALLTFILAAGLTPARSVAVTPNYCGDPCSPNGARIGCIDTSGPVWRRLICTCVNGRLDC